MLVARPRSRWRRSASRSPSWRGGCRDRDSCSPVLVTGVRALNGSDPVGVETAAPPGDAVDAGRCRLDGRRASVTVSSSRRTRTTSRSSACDAAARSAALRQRNGVSDERSRTADCAEAFTAFVGHRTERERARHRPDPPVTRVGNRATASYDCYLGSPGQAPDTGRPRDGLVNPFVASVACPGD